LATEETDNNEGEVKLFRRGFREFPDMPNHQPCPQCQKRSKRESKTLGGANYLCPKHGIFFMRAERR